MIRALLGIQPVIIKLRGAGDRYAPRRRHAPRKHLMIAHQVLRPTMICGLLNVRMRFSGCQPPPAGLMMIRPVADMLTGRYGLKIRCGAAQILDKVSDFDNSRGQGDVGHQG